LPFSQKTDCSTDAATCEAVRQYRSPWTITTATAIRGESAGAAPMNHSYRTPGF